MNKIFLFLLFFTVFSCREASSDSGNVKSNTNAVSQKKKSDIASELIAHSEWRLENRVAQKLGQSCTNEEYLSFEKDSLTHTICKDGKLQTTKECWKLAQAEDGQWKMIMADRQYSLIISGSTFILNNVSGQKDQDSSGRKFIGESNE